MKIFVTVRIFFSSKLSIYACFGNIIIIIQFSCTEITHLGLHETHHNKFLKLLVKSFLHKRFPSSPDICSCILLGCRCDPSWAHIKHWWPFSKTAGRQHFICIFLSISELIPPDNLQCCATRLRQLASVTSKWWNEKKCFGIQRSSVLLGSIFPRSQAAAQTHFRFFVPNFRLY